MKKKDILAILIPSFIFALAWIILSIHHNFASSTISEALNTQIAPIAAAFDTNTITNLKGRQNIIPTYETNIPVENIVIPATASATITPTPVINNEPISSSSGNITTPGGALQQ